MSSSPIRIGASWSSSRPCATCGTGIVTSPCTPHRGRPHRRRTKSAGATLADLAKIGAAADRVLRSSPVRRCLVVKIRKGFFSWDFDDKARSYGEEFPWGRFVITTSLTTSQASAAQVLSYYKRLQNLEGRFRVMKDLLSPRPMLHRTEARVRGHVAPCVLAAAIEAVMAQDLVRAKRADPDLPLRSMTEGGPSLC